jgi:hypothetical protein
LGNSFYSPNGWIPISSDPKMVRHGLPMSEDDIMPNHTNIDIMEKLNKGIPFRGG